MKNSKNIAVETLRQRLYRANKKQNIFIIIAIILTTFMFITIFNTGISYWDAMNKRNVGIDGMKYDISLTEPTEEQVEKAKTIEEIDYSGVAVKCAILQKYSGKPIDVRMYWSDETNWSKQCIPAFEFVKGTYPAKDGEIMLSSLTLNELGISNPKIGMKITLTYQPMGKDETKEKEFVLSGYFRDYTGASKGYVSEEFYKSTGTKQTDYSQGLLYITLKNHLYTKNTLNMLEEELNLGETQSIQADIDTTANFYRLMIGLTVLTLLIVVSGYLFIYNTFYIMLAKEVRFYGQLKTLGMEIHQMKKIFYSWIFLNSGIGIMVGLILGAGVSYVSMPLLLSKVNASLDASKVIEIHPLLFLVSGVFSFCTILISTRKPIQIISEMSPIEAAKYTGIRGKVKKKKSTSAKLYKMAWRNIFREKKQAFIILMSFVITLTVCISVNQIIYGNTAKSILNHFYKYDARISNNTWGQDDETQVITANEISQVKDLEGVLGVKVVTSAKIAVPYNESFENYFKQLYEIPGIGNYKTDMEAYKKNPESDYYLGQLIGIDEEGEKEILKSLDDGVDSQSFINGETGILYPCLGVSAKEIIGKNMSFYFPLDSAKNSYSMKIIDENITDSLCYAGAGNAPGIIVSEELFEKLVSNPIVENITITYSESFNKELDTKIQKIFSSKSENLMFDLKTNDYDEMKKSEDQLKVLGGCIEAIIAFLAVMNFVNIMLTGIQSRKKEFAVMESIGMTSKQLRQLLLYEGMFYGLISIGCSMVVGGPISYMIYQVQNKYQIEFAVPILNDIFVFVGVLFVCMAIPLITYKFTEKKSIIEELREVE